MNENEILKIGDVRPRIGKTELAEWTELGRELVKSKRDAEMLPRAKHTEMVTEEVGGRSQEVGEEKVRGSGGRWSSRRGERDWRADIGARGPGTDVDAR